MAKKLSSVLGVDIGSQSIKICEIKTQGREPVVTALGIIATPEGTVDENSIYNPDEVGKALKSVISQSGASVSQVVISISGQQSVLVRTLEVPKMNPQELRDHMQWEINRNQPFSESTVTSDYKPLGGDDPNSPNMDVVMAIATQSAIDALVSLSKKAGRQIAAIDVEPLSMARSIQRSYDDVLADKTICLVDIGHLSTSINIYLGQRLVMPRQVPIGGQMLTNAIADAMTLPLPEAETLKRERCRIPESAGINSGFGDPFGGDAQGFQPFNPFSDDPIPAFVPPAEPTLGGYAPSDPTGNYAAQPDPYSGAAINPVTGEPYGDFAATDPYAAPAEDPYASIDPYAATEPAVDTTPVPASDLDPEAQRLYDAVAPILAELVSEIRRSIDYYVSRGGVVDVVEVCGGGSKLQGLVAFFGRALGVECDAYDPLRRLNLNMKKVPSAFVDEHRQEFTIAVGNGLHIFFE